MFTQRSICSAGESQAQEVSDLEAIRDCAPGLRLAKRKWILDLIEHRRKTECDMGIGGAIERRILSEELASLNLPDGQFPSKRREVL